MKPSRGLQHHAPPTLLVGDGVGEAPSPTPSANHPTTIGGPTMCDGDTQCDACAERGKRLARSKALCTEGMGPDEGCPAPLSMTMTRGEDMTARLTAGKRRR